MGTRNNKLKIKNFINGHDPFSDRKERIRYVLEMLLRGRQKLTLKTILAFFCVIATFRELFDVLDDLGIKCDYVPTRNRISFYCPDTRTSFEVSREDVVGGSHYQEMLDDGCMDILQAKVANEIDMFQENSCKER